MLLIPYLTGKSFLIEEIIKYYRRVEETMNRAVEVNIYQYHDFQIRKLI